MSDDKYKHGSTTAGGWMEENALTGTPTTEVSSAALKTTATPCHHPSIVQLEQCDKITTQCTKCGKKLKVTALPQIQSAYLNISTAISDAESAIDAWENEKWANAVMSIDLALEQLQSARYKIQQYKQK